MLIRALRRAALALALLAGTVRADGPFHEITFDQAKAKAKEAGKVVMVDFYTSWCQYCRKLEQTTWRDSEVGEWLTAETIPIRVNAEQEFSVAQAYDVHSYPTIVFIKPDGAAVGRHVGYLAPGAFLDMADRALFKKSTLERAKEAVDAHPEDPLLHRKYGLKLEAAGRSKDALDQYLWCFDKGAESPSFVGLRTTFLMSDLARLARAFPPAKEPLLERARVREEALLAGRGTADLARELAALNEAAGEQQRSVEAWGRIRSGGLDPALAEAMFEQVFEDLIEERRYADVVAGAGDTLQRVDGLVQRFWIASQNLGQDAESELVAYLREQVVADGAKYYEALLGAGRPAEAAGVAERLLTFQPSGKAYGALIERAARAEAWGAARALVDRGLAELPRDQQFSIRKAAKSLPKGAGE